MAASRMSVPSIALISVLFFSLMLASSIVESVSPVGSEAPNKTSASPPATSTANKTANAPALSPKAADGGGLASPLSTAGAAAGSPVTGPSASAKSAAGSDISKVHVPIVVGIALSAAWLL